MKFLRRDWNRHPKLGKKRKDKQVWRRPKGRDNKMREKRKGYPKVVSPGYEKEKTVKGKINDKEPITITKVSELDLAAENNMIPVLGRVGKKRKMEIAKKAYEKGIEIANLNPKKYLKKAEFENKKKKETKDARTAKKKAREEKAKKKSSKKESSEKSNEKQSSESKKEDPKQKTETKKSEGNEEKSTTKPDSESKTKENK